MKKFLLLVGIAILGPAAVSFGASVVVTFDSGSQTLTNSTAVTLTGGTAADGDGTVLQLGYYSQATIANNFLGTWVPLSGEGSLNTGTISGSSPLETYNKTSIGDLTSRGGTNGKFALNLTFTVSDPLTGNSLPSSTSIPLAVRFYNGLTIATSTEFNVVSDDTWLWKAPSEGGGTPIGFSLDDANLEWLNGAASAFKTVVPEPSTAILALVSGSALLLQRRRRVA